MNIFLGTEVKLLIKIDDIGDLTMKDYEWNIEAYTSKRRSVTINSSEAIETSEGYIVKIDTSLLGVGIMYCKITAEIPDPELDNITRREVVIIDPDINIVDSL